MCFQRSQTTSYNNIHLQQITMDELLSQLKDVLKEMRSTHSDLQSIHNCAIECKGLLVERLLEEVDDFNKKVEVLEKEIQEKDNVIRKHVNQEQLGSSVERSEAVNRLLEETKELKETLRNVNGKVIDRNNLIEEFNELRRKQSKQVAGDYGGDWRAS